MRVRGRERKGEKEGEVERREERWSERERELLNTKYRIKKECITSVCSAKTVPSSFRSGSPYSLPLESMAK